MNSIISRIPPHNIEAEQSVLGSMLLDKEAIASATEILKGEDFYSQQHTEIFNAVVELYRLNMPVDLVTLSNKFKNTDVLEKVGGITYLTQLLNSVPTSTNVKYYCKIVEEKSVLRNLIIASSEILEDSYQASHKAADLIEEAEKRIFDISQRQSRGDFMHIQEALYNTFEKLEEVHNSNSQITGITTGFADIDLLTAGLQKSDLVLIAARPSMGKTAFALNIAQNTAIKSDNSVAVFSLEMSKEQLTQRMLCAEAQVDSKKLRTGDLNDLEWQKIAHACTVLSNSKIYIDDTPGIGIMEMRSKCRRLKIEHGLDLILIDYLQLMTGSRRSENRQQEISELSRSLKALAREMDCPVVALSQLSRAPDARADHRPVLSDLRESGAIEQDADVVMLLFREFYYSRDPEVKNLAELNIAKQRNGPTKVVKLVWLEQFTKFVNHEGYRQ